MVGDVLIAEEFPGLLWHVRWTGTAFQVTVLFQVPQWEHVTFSTAGIEEIPPITNKCPLTQGFWKNHPDDWSVTSLTLGNQTYSQMDLLALLQSPVKGDASLILAHQLIAAKLNIANGSDPTPVSATLTDADNLLSAFPGKLPYKVKPSSASGQAMVNDADVLDSYYNGELKPDCEP